MTQFIHIVIIGMTLLGVGVIIISKNVIHAAYALALVLISVAGIYVLLSAELLAVVQILLYAGGVVILLIFGVMMTNRFKGGKLLTASKNTILAGIVSISIFAALVYLLSNIAMDWNSNSNNTNQIEVIGTSFLTDHIVAFELIAFVLLVALVGASYLAKMSSNE